MSLPDPSLAFSVDPARESGRTGDEPVLAGALRQKAVWVDEAVCIGCRYCAHVAGNTFVVETEWGRSRAIRQDGGADIGFRWNAAGGCYELVADLDLWRQPVPVERFLAQLNQRYALRAILAASAEEGFQVTEQREHRDGTIELVVSRWDG